MPQNHVLDPGNESNADGFFFRDEIIRSTANTIPDNNSNTIGVGIHETRTPSPNTIAIPNRDAQIPSTTAPRRFFARSGGSDKTLMKLITCYPDIYSEKSRDQNKRLRQHQPSLLPGDFLHARRPERAECPNIQIDEIPCRD